MFGKSCIPAVLAAALLATAAAPQEAGADFEYDAFVWSNNGVDVATGAYYYDGAFVWSYLLDEYYIAWEHAWLGDFYADFAYENGLDAYFYEAHIESFYSYWWFDYLYSTLGVGTDWTLFSREANYYAFVFSYYAWTT